MKKSKKPVLVNCDYCGQPAHLVNGLVIYPNRPDLADLSFYLCSPCQAYVGCHKGTLQPLGRLANAELRKYKSIAHKYFDAYWRNGTLKRTEAYSLLAERMKILKKHCHIGKFSVQQCKQVIAICVNEGLIKTSTISAE